MNEETLRATIESLQNANLALVARIDRLESNVGSMSQDVDDMHEDVATLAEVLDRLVRRETPHEILDRVCQKLIDREQSESN